MMRKYVLIAACLQVTYVFLDIDMTDIVMNKNSQKNVKEVIPIVARSDILVTSSHPYTLVNEQCL